MQNMCIRFFSIKFPLQLGLTYTCMSLDYTTASEWYQTTIEGNSKELMHNIANFNIYKDKQIIPIRKTTSAVTILYGS